MSVFTIVGGQPLSGAVGVQGAKNSALPLLAATVLAEGVSVLKGCPRLTDTQVAVHILRHIGCRVWEDGNDLYVDSSGPITPEIPEALMRRMRSSVVFLGPILARTGEAVLSAPGGCQLGPRPVDLHVAALRSLGAEIDDRDGGLRCRAAKLSGSRIDLPTPSVGATENAMLAAARASGLTVITGAAREPEIEDLQRFLQKAGALVSGAGSGVIRVRGVEKLHGAVHRVLPDRIAAATWLCACAAAGGEVTLYDTEPRHYAALLRSLREMGCQLRVGEGTVTLRRTEPLQAPRPIVTKPYPGFPTDAQPLLMAACLRATGSTVFIETIFESRYRHAEELRLLGADVRTAGRTAVVQGVERLQGAALTAADLRGGAALAIAALSAEGESTLQGAAHIDRGYARLEETLRALGAEIIRKGEP